MRVPIFNWLVRPFLPMSIWLQESGLIDDENGTAEALDDLRQAHQRHRQAVERLVAAVVGPLPESRGQGEIDPGPHPGTPSPG